MKPLTPTTPSVIMLVGIPGAGKTTFAEHFAKTFSTPYLNPRTISRQAGIGVDKAEKVSDLLFDELLKTDRTILFEGPTETKAERAEVIKHAQHAGYHTVLVWVQTEPVEAQRRATRKRQNSTPLTADEFKNAFHYFEAPLPTEKPVVISGRHTYASQLKVVLKNIARDRPATRATPAPRPAPRPGLQAKGPHSKTRRNIIIS